MKRAFTLIELLVVIAIIAILAAILFPVFAQAKAAAKKTANLSNIKQSTLGQQMYAADVDDNLPLALLGNTNNTGVVKLDDWNFASPATQDTYSTFWAASMQPYLKSFELIDDASQKVWNPYAYSVRNKMSHFTMNSYLNLMSGTAVGNPAAVVAFWPGLGAQRLVGLANSKPTVYMKTSGFPSAASPAFRFARSGNECTGFAYLTYGTGDANNELKWNFAVFGRVANMSYVDGHAKSINVDSPQYPWILDKTGRPESYWINTTDYNADNNCDYNSVLSPERMN